MSWPVSVAGAACPLCQGRQAASFAALPLAGNEVYRYVQCEQCALAQLADRPVQRDLGDFYAEEYQPVCGEFASGQRSMLSLVLEANFRRIAGRIERLGRRGRLLDVGCGAGVFLDTMRRRGWEVAGIEPNRALARGLGQSRGLPVHAGTLDDLPADWGDFDAVTLFHLIEHVPDPRATLCRVATLLRPGGVLLIVTPNVASIEHRLFGRDWYALQPPDHLWLFSAGSLLRVVTESGFQDPSLVASSVSYGWTSLRRRLGLRPLPALPDLVLKVAAAAPLALAGKLRHQPAELELYATQPA